MARFFVSKVIMRWGFFRGDLTKYRTSDELCNQKLKKKIAVFIVASKTKHFFDTSFKRMLLEQFVSEI